MANERELAEFVYTQLLNTGLLSPDLSNDNDEFSKTTIDTIEAAITEFNSRDEQMDENVEPEEE